MEAAGLMQANKMFPFIVSVAESPDSITKSGIYSYNDETTGSMIGYNWGIVVHFQNSNGWGTFQIATANLDDKHLYFRKKINSTWSSWAQII